MGALRNKQKERQLKMSDKTLTLLCFTMASFVDAKITQFLIELGIASEANPIMLIAMNAVPHGMWVLKGMASLTLLLILDKVSLEFLIAIAAGMSAVLLWNFGLLLTWLVVNFAR